MAETTKRHFPAYLDLNQRLAVVVGEGAAAEKRVRQLVRYGADVVVVTPQPSEALIQAEADGQITMEQRSYVRGDLAGAFVALCVTDDSEVRRAVFDEAESLGCLVNVAGSPEYCSFVLPSIIHRDSLQIAISTGGAAPEVARRLRQQLDSEIGREWGAWVTLLTGLRSLVLTEPEDIELQRRALEIAVREETFERLSLGDTLTVPLMFDKARQERDAAEAEAAEAEAEPDVVDETEPEEGE
ncbi:MAG TPA: bifunctional precorrin-2 dehydrogenase/sirohydrochlorin ferrochelatase [Coriobacteriia bacterium]|nr:bifunctional precorrin-2 dehydrogenase/sirohydrochlorin ferrochelatase [Coriobacteriia bacterium]